MKTKKWTKCDRFSYSLCTQIFEDYASGLSLASVGRKYGVSRRQVENVVEKCGGKIRLRHEHRRCSLDESVFDDPLTTEAKYWVGFLMADGCVTFSGETDNETCVVLGLKSSDGAHVQEFREFVEIGRAHV